MDVQNLYNIKSSLLKELSNNKEIWHTDISKQLSQCIIDINNLISMIEHPKEWEKHKKLIS